MDLLLAEKEQNKRASTQMMILVYTITRGRRLAVSASSCLSIPEEPSEPLGLGVVEVQNPDGLSVAKVLEEFAGREVQRII